LRSGGWKQGGVDERQIGRIVHIEIVESAYWEGLGQTGANRSKTSCEVPERTLGRISIVVKLPNSRASVAQL
jgi:hypothetical protein